MFAPRIGFAWSPSRLKNVVVRGGFGMYADRGEYFTELSASAGLGISGPFSVTTQEPFTVPDEHDLAWAGMSAGAPFGTTPFLPLRATYPKWRADPQSVTIERLPRTGYPYLHADGLANSDFLFGGYDPTNKLPYSENWSLDLQWQPKNNVVLTVGLYRKSWRAPAAADSIQPARRSDAQQPH